MIPYFQCGITLNLQMLAIGLSWSIEDCGVSILLGPLAFWLQFS